MKLARRIAWTLALGLGATLVSLYVPGSEQISYPDIDSCIPTCSVVVAGFPFAFIVDYPGISPGNFVSVAEVLLGIDILRVPQFIGTLVPAGV